MLISQSVKLVAVLLLLSSSLPHAQTPMPPPLASLSSESDTASKMGICDVLHCHEVSAVLQAVTFKTQNSSSSDDLEKAGEDAATILQWLNEQTQKFWAWFSDELLGLLRDIIGN